MPMLAFLFLAVAIALVGALGVSTFNGRALYFLAAVAIAIYASFATLATTMFRELQFSAECLSGLEQGVSTRFVALCVLDLTSWSSGIGTVSWILVKHVSSAPPFADYLGVILFSALAVVPAGLLCGPRWANRLEYIGGIWKRPNHHTAIQGFLSEPGNPIEIVFLTIAFSIALADSMPADFASALGVSIFFVLSLFASGLILAVIIFVEAIRMKLEHPEAS